MTNTVGYVNYGHETFNYARDIIHLPNDGLLVIEADGFVAMNPVEGAYATVSELRRREKEGTLLSASVITELIDAKGNRALALVRRSNDAQFEPGKLQFPAGRCDKHEAACDTAIRELFEELRVVDQGTIVDRGDVRFFMGRHDDQPVYFVPSGGFNSTRKFRCAGYTYEAKDNTVEFYFRSQISVADLAAVEVGSNESYHQIELVDPRLISQKVEEFTRAAQSGLKYVTEPEECLACDAIQRALDRLLPEANR